MLEFAGGDHHTTILSTCFHALAPFLSWEAATQLRATCNEARAAISAHPFDSLPSAHLAGKGAGTVRGWRACFPSARSVSLRFRPDITGEELAPLLGVERVDLYGAALAAPAPAAAFAPLRRALQLDVGHVVTLREGALAHLGELRVLRMAWCRQRCLTGGAFAFARSLRVLDMTLCWQEELGDAALAALAAHGVLRVLRMGGCSQASITDGGVAGVVEGAPLEELDISGCTQLSDACVAGALEGLAAGARARLRLLDVSFVPRFSGGAREALQRGGVVVVKRKSEREV